MKRLLCILVLISVLLGSGGAAQAQTDYGGNGEYAITAFKIRMIVNENNSFLISEDIQAHFNVDKHGIIRSLPLRNEVVRLSGGKSFNRAKISDIEVNEQFSLSNKSGYRHIKIGDPGRKIIGDRQYSLSYLYDIGPDRNKEFDEFYFNLIGTEWDTTISNVEFEIMMPKDFDQSKLGFSAGPKGFTDSSKVDWQVQGKTISGSYQGVLRPKEGLTIRLELPDHYFTGGPKIVAFGLYFSELLLIILPAIFLVLTIFLWLRYGKNDPVVETVEFYPPKGLNSAQVGLLYKGVADQKDVLSLLVYLANQGYFRIEETVQKVLFAKKSSFKLIKEKDYKGKNTQERQFMKGLFEHQSDKGEVTAGVLRNSFYLTLEKILSHYNKKEKQAVFEQDKRLLRRIPLVLALGSALLVAGKVLINYDLWWLILLFAAGFFVLGFALFFDSFQGRKSPKERLVGLGGVFILALLPSAGLVALGTSDQPQLFPVFLWGLIAALIMLVFSRLMPKRTPYGNEMLGKIKGFRRFLATAEKPKLEALVHEDPMYFYNILPYTYALGVSDKWIKKFETIAIEPPSWYAEDAAFNAVHFNRFITSTMGSASKAMTSSPSGSGGGGGSGGGSSGGGSGGGGGSSW